MTLVENTAKFSKVVNTLGTKKRDVLQVARALVIADTAHIGDPERGKFEHLTLDGLADTGITELQGVCYGCEGHAEPWSDVMQMRIMCDVLTLLLDGSYPFALKYSADVAKAMQQRQRTKEGRYLEFDECEAILSAYYDAVSTNFEEYLRPLFEKTSFFLRELQRLQPLTNPSKSIINTDCVSEIWLPEEFDASGFKVSKREPAVISRLNGDKTRYVVLYNMAYIMDILIKVITRLDKGTTAQTLFISRLTNIGRKSPNLFPVGVDINSGVREAVYKPSHFINNQALFVMYERYFTSKSPLTVESVENTIKAIDTWYNS